MFLLCVTWNGVGHGGGGGGGGDGSRGADVVIGVADVVIGGVVGVDSGFVSADAGSAELRCSLAPGYRADGDERSTIASYSAILVCAALERWAWPASWRCSF